MHVEYSTIVFMTVKLYNRPITRYFFPILKRATVAKQLSSKSKSQFDSNFLLVYAESHRDLLFKSCQYLQSFKPKTP